MDGGSNKIWNFWTYEKANICITYIFDIWIINTLKLDKACEPDNGEFEIKLETEIIFYYFWAALTEIIFYYF